MKSPRPVALVLLGVLLSGCNANVGAILAPPPLETFDLTAPRVTRPGLGRGNLLVAEATTVRALDTDRILVRPKPNEIAYLGGAQWSDRLPRLVQTRLIEAFQNAKRLATVSRPGEGVEAPLQLLTEIRSFEIDISAGGVARVDMTARLVGTRSGRVAAAEVFSAERKAASTEGAAAAAALDQALADVLTRIVEWTGRKG